MEASGSPHTLEDVTPCRCAEVLIPLLLGAHGGSGQLLPLCAIPMLSSSTCVMACERLGDIFLGKHAHVMMQLECGL